MRGAFDSEVAVYYGPESPYGTPDALRQDEVPARVVPQRQIEQFQFPFNLSSVWVTLDELVPNGPQTKALQNGWTFDNYFTADQVVISSLPDLRFICARVEEVAPFDRPIYWRCLLLPVIAGVIPGWLPPSDCPCVSPPPPPPAPGPICCEAFGLTADVPYVREASTDSDEWYTFVQPDSGPFSLELTDVGGEVSSELYLGPQCTSLMYVDAFEQEFCHQFDGSTAGLRFFLRVQTTNPHTYRVIAQSSDC